MPVKFAYTNPYHFHIIIWVPAPTESCNECMAELYMALVGVVYPNYVGCKSEVQGS
jgi:hypothetical protein